MESEKGIAALFLATGIVITVDEIGNVKLSPSRYYGLVGGFFVIAVIGTFQPGFATALAWLFFLGTLLSRGTRVVDRFTTLTKGR